MKETVSRTTFNPFFLHGLLLMRRALRLRLRDKPVGVRHNIGEVGRVPASRGGFQHHTAQGRRAADAHKPCNLSLSQAAMTRVMHTRDHVTHA